MKRPKVATVILVALASLSVAAAVLFALSPYRVFVIHTGSMDGTIPSRSAVIDHVGEYHVGQVVTFKVNGATVTHRLIEIRSDNTITSKGDGNRSADPWHVPVTNIIGGVVSAPKYLGWWLVFLFRTTGGLSVLLFILAIWQCWHLLKAFESSKPTEVPATT